jgi:hypothetical protein
MNDSKMNDSNSLARAHGLRSAPLPESPIPRGRGFIPSDPSSDAIVAANARAEQLAGDLASARAALERSERVNEELRETLATVEQKAQARVDAAAREVVDARARADYASARLGQVLAELDAKVERAVGG